MENVSHKFATVNGVRLHYVEAGEGDQLLVLLHGWPEFWYSWKFQIAHFSKKYRVIAPDLRGFNESDKPKGVNAYKASVVAKDIVELIKFLGHEKATIIGHDWGGAITWKLLDSFRESVEQAFILNCPEPSVMIRHLKSNPKQMLKSAYIFLFQIPVLPQYVLKLSLREVYKREVMGRVFNKSAFQEGDIDKYVEAMGKKGAIDATINYYRAGMQLAFKSDKKMNNEQNDLPNIHLIWGESDHVLSKEMILDTKRKYSKNTTLDFIPQCSHWVQNDAHDEVNKIIDKYL